jgi:hypothetical protein
MVFQLIHLVILLFYLHHNPRTFPLQHLSLFRWSTKEESCVPLSGFAFVPCEAQKGSTRINTRQNKWNHKKSLNGNVKLIKMYAHLSQEEYEIINKEFLTSVEYAREELANDYFNLLFYWNDFLVFISPLECLRVGIWNKCFFKTLYLPKHRIIEHIVF